jgi:hypothetical protein
MCVSVCVCVCVSDLTVRASSVLIEARLVSRRRMSHSYLRHCWTYSRPASVWELGDGRERHEREKVI